MTAIDPPLAEVPLAILAGGAGSRVQSISERLPKALFEVNGRPFIAYQLELAHRNGVRRVVLCTGHLGEQIEAYVGRGHSFGLDVVYSSDGDVLLGTAGALKKAEPLLGPLFWVMYGDTYLPVTFPEVFAAFQGSSALGLMTVFENGNRFDRSNVVYRDGRLRVYDKRTPTPDMAHIDYGLSLLRQASLGGLEAGVFADLGDLYHDLVARGLMEGFEVHRRFYEIGSPRALAETSRFLARQAVEATAGRPTLS